MKLLSILIEQEQLTAQEKEYDKIGQNLEAAASAQPKLLDDPKFRAKLDKYRAWKKGKSQPATTADKPANATAGVQQITGVDTSVQLNVEQLKSAFNFNSAVKSEVIAQVQKILEHFKITPVGKPGVNDERFIYALANFQKKAGLAATGKYDNQTKAAMEKQLKTNPLPKTDKPTDTNTQNQNQNQDQQGENKPETPGINPATTEDFNKLPGQMFTHSGSNIQYKIVKTMPYRNDNDVTMVLLAQHLEGLVFFFIFGLDPVKRREFIPDVSTDKIKSDQRKMEQLFTTEYRLKGPYLYGPNTLPDTIGQKIS
jgi:hypothetical protein